MAQNPFKPPQAQLEVEEELAPVPMRVKIAVMALIAGAVMSFALRAAMARAIDDIFLPALLQLLLLGVLAWKIFVGRDWARWVLAAVVAMGALGLASIFYLPPEFMARVPQVLRIAGFIQFALNLAALVLVFTGAGAKWFGR